MEQGDLQADLVLRTLGSSVALILSALQSILCSDTCVAQGD